MSHQSALATRTAPAAFRCPPSLVHSGRMMLPAVRVGQLHAGGVVALDVGDVEEELPVGAGRTPAPGR